jgi:imidazolonepropionase
MADLLITHIKGLVQTRETGTGPAAGKAMGDLPVLADAYVAMENGVITDMGPMHMLRASLKAKETILAAGRFVFPSFVDSHTHLVFAASREEEFVMKLKGASYAEIAAKGGGILNSAARLQTMSEEELFQRSVPRAWEIMASGTGAVEIKSGYGLTVDDELKMLRVARRIGKETPLTVKTTFLGAHAVPSNHTRESYIKLVIDEMIPAVASESLADYIDVFCEEGFFTVDDTLQVAENSRQSIASFRWCSGRSEVRSHQR